MHTHIRWVALAFLIAAIGTSLLAQGGATPANLKNFSRQQLIACMDTPGKCRARDLYEVEAELDKRLPQMSTDELVHCYADWHICGDSEPWRISEILRARGQTEAVIREYGFSADPLVRNGVETLAYDSSSKAAADYIRTVFAKRLDDGENLYWPAMYLAKRCDVAALGYLDPGPKSKSIADKFSVSSAQFAETAELFGKCRYRPAIPYLVVIGLHAASLNLVDAADRSLRRFYPDSPKFDSLEAEQRSFCKRAERDGFPLDCKAVMD